MSNLVLLTSDFKPLTGGIAEHLHGLWSALSETEPGWVFSTVATEGADWPRTYTLHELVPFPTRNLGARPGDSLPPLRKLNTALYFEKCKRAAFSHIDELQRVCGPLSEVFVGLWTPDSHFWCEALRARGIAYVLFAHGLDLVASLPDRASAWRREDFALARRVIACSRSTADLLVTRLGVETSVGVVYPGVAEQPQIPTPAADDAGPVPAAWETDQLIALSVCRLIPRKGIDMTLRALAMIKDDVPELRYLVAGDGPDRQRLTDLVEELSLQQTVRLLGYIDDSTRNALYRRCDLFVMPVRDMGGTDFEGFGISYLEAALARKPVIGGNVGGVREAIVEGETGLLVNGESADEVARAIARLARDPALRQRMGLSAKERALRDFSYTSAANSFRSLRVAFRHDQRVEWPSGSPRSLVSGSALDG